MSTKHLRIEKCPEQGGTCVVATSLHDAVQEVVNHCKRHGSRSGRTSEWHGRIFESWDEIGAAFTKPWADGLKRVQELLEEIRKEHIAPPESVKRRSEWTELDGEVDSDRALAGSPDFFRHTRKRSIQTPTNVAILCNVGNTGGYSGEQIFWRGAAAIAAIDLLEEAGYNCEVWCWNHALGCFYQSGYESFFRRRGAYTVKSESLINETHPQGGSSFFYTAKLKECGEALDVDRLVNGLSAWFFRTIIFGMRDVVKPGCHGSGSSQHIMGKWIDKMDISQGIIKVDVPSVFSREGAINTAKKILEKVKTGDNEKLENEEEE